MPKVKVDPRDLALMDKEQLGELKDERKRLKEMEAKRISKCRELVNDQAQLDLNMILETDSIGELSS